MRRALLALFSTIAGLVMLLSFKTEATGTGATSSALGTAEPGTDPAAGAGTPATGGASSSTAAGSTTAPSAGSTTAPSAAASAAAPTSAAAGSGTTASSSGTYTGAAASTRYGPVQVQVTVTDGKVSSVTAVEYPTTNPRDAEINARAVPELNQEATAARSAKIDVVSGATYTSDGYITSLQSALDAAGL